MCGDPIRMMAAQDRIHGLEERLELARQQFAEKAIAEVAAGVKLAELVASDGGWRSGLDDAGKLWMLLDDIDTLDDACKGDDSAFREGVRHVQRKRFLVRETPDGTPPDESARSAPAEGAGK